jgi:hypothetical protein
MPTTFEPTKQGLRQLTRHLNQRGAGTTVYTITEQRDWGIGRERTFSDWTFTRISRLTGQWVTDGGTSLGQLMSSYGAVYTDPPRGIRHAAAPAPQVAGPLGADYEGVLDEAELRGLEKQVRDSSNPRTRRPVGSWRI